MKSIKRLCGYFFIIFLFLNNQTRGQNNEVTWRDRLYFGFNLEPIFFGDVTSFSIAPLAGYRITPRWSAGIGFKYEYYRASKIYGNFSTSMYGGSLFTNYVLWKDFINQGIALIAQGEYEALSLDRKYFESPFLSSGRFIMNSVLIGGGVKQRLGGRVSLNTLILWNLNQMEPSPYSNPVIRFSLIF